LAATLDIDLLRTFVAVNETGSLSRAAPRIGRTQAAISMQIKRLEELIGLPLLTRGGRGVKLTREGERLLAHAHEILSRHDEAVTDLIGHGLSGIIRFGCPDDYAVSFLPGLIGDFVSRHPQVMIEVVCASTPRLHEQLRDHAIELALVSVLEGGSAEPSIRTEPLVWIAKSSATLAIDPLPLALSDPDGLDHIHARSGLDLQGRKYRVAYASGSLTGLLAVVRSGQALAVLARSAAPADLQIFGREHDLPALPDLGIVVAFDRPRPSPVVNAFAEHIRAALPGNHRVPCPLK
jgi:DNA-binding transcriptional LysR family regulator